VEAVNKALYEQVEAAGASAATLALLGVATGQFTQEQAEAALKAAVLHEQIRAIAASVAAGDLSINDALGQLNQAREALDAAPILAAVPGTGEGGVVDCRHRRHLNGRNEPRRHGGATGRAYQ
jgi:hypothetical protein